jgi:hypothetical protein
MGDAGQASTAARCGARDVASAASNPRRGRARGCDGWRGRPCGFEAQVRSANVLRPPGRRRAGGRAIVTHVTHASRALASSSARALGPA